MKATLLWGGFESSIYPEIVTESLLNSDCILIVDTPKNRSGNAHAFNEALQTSIVADYYLINPGSIYEIKEKIKSWMMDFDINVSFNTTEEFMVTAALCNDYFGWAGPGFYASYISSDKSVQRRLLPHLSPKRILSSELLAGTENISFPVVLKPVNKHGGSGFKLIESKEDLSVFRAEDLVGYVAEEYVTGTDCSVEAIVLDGEIVFQGVTEEVSLHRPQDYLEMGYYQPPLTLSDDTINKLKDANAKLISEVRFRSGIIHAEYRVKEDGKVVFIEFAARPPGDSLLAMYRLSTGESLERQIFKSLKSEAVSYPEANRFVAQEFFSHRPGILKGVSFPIDVDASVVNYYAETHVRKPSAQAKDGDTIHEINVFAQRNKPVRRLVEASDRVASAIFSSPTKSGILSMREQTIAQILVETEDNVLC